MSEIIEHSDNGHEQTIAIGDAGARIPIKAYQDVYHQITGRTEQIRKRYREHLLIEFTDISQLNYKIEQLCNVHRVVANNTSVSIFHKKDRKEQFTSFDRFHTYNSGATSPTINTIIKYNFSIIPAGIERAQEYVITIRLTSRVAIMQQLEEEGDRFGDFYFHYIDFSPAEITVDYVDYIVARGFVEAFDEWVKGCKATPNIRGLGFLQQQSHFIPHGAKILAALGITWYALQSIPTFLANNSGDELWVRYFVLYVGGGYILIMFAALAGKLVENAIDSYPILSYLNLNKGDEKLIHDFGSRKKKNFIKFMIASFLSIIIGIISSKLSMLV